ncbi:MAG: beta-galactosidase [Fimbriimonadaceae bacterium]|nr:beta-galactosidase [Fimbriimonadaceae bacterium]
MPLLALLLPLVAPPTLPRVGVIAVHDGTIPPAAIRQQMQLGYALNWRPASEQAALAAAGCLSMHFEPRPGADRLHAGLELTEADCDQDADGHLADEGYRMATFDPRVIDRYATLLREALRERANQPWVAAISVPSPISRYGEAHYAVSDQGGYLTASRPARQSFRRWLQQQYGDLQRLSAAWGRVVPAWDAIEPPRGPQPGPDGLDRRTVWSDYQHWYHGWLLQVTDRTFAAVREVTDRPLVMTLGGMKAGYAQGVFSGNVGPTVRGLAAHRPVILDDTDAQTLFSQRYTGAACAQYGVTPMCEPVGPPHLSEYAQLNALINALSVGSSSVILPHLGELCQPDHWFTRIWSQLGPAFAARETAYRPTAVAVFHSYVSSWYRADRQNMDAVRLYDATNTNWSPDPSQPSWGRALGNPDVLDDQMIADGALAGRRLLVIPNSGQAVTTRAAVEAIRQWVLAGGTLVAFGEGCLAVTVETDRQLQPTPRLAGMLTAPATGRTVQPLGAGQVIAYQQAAHPTANAAFCQQVQQELTTLVDALGVAPAGRIAPATANLLDCGADRRSGRRLFCADFLATVGPPVTFLRGEFRLTFDQRLHGPAELLAVTAAPPSCRGGSAAWDPTTRLLTVRWELPGALTLRW